MPNLRGLVFGLLNNRLPTASVQGLILALSAICLVVVFIGGFKTFKGRSLVIAIPASAAVSYHFHLHDMAILLLPILVLLNQCIQAVPTGDLYQRRIAQFAALVFIAPAAFCFSPSHFYLASLPICAFLFAVLRWEQAKTRPLDRTGIV
jgi:hypothetical protein